MAAALSMASVQTKGTDTLPSGSWGIGPLVIHWSLKSQSEIDVEVSVFGIDVDELTATLSARNAKISDDIDILGIITGSIGLEARFAPGAKDNGLYLEGRLSGPGFDTGEMDFRIVPW
ncbi:MAG TPA: hypothetical protein VMS78_09120 [Rhizomicrobium sp.]|nr:hypothetical protein [Rhizomicrobium sp.]